MTRHLPTLAKYAALLVAAVLTLGPVWWTFTTSLRPAAESFSLPPSFFPLQPDFSSYAAVFEQIKIPLLVLNSEIGRASCRERVENKVTDADRKTKQQTPRLDST